MSGDHNPLHVDPLTARRLLLGAPAVHGIHGLLWLLDNSLAEMEQRLKIESLKAIFPEPIRVGSKVVMVIAKSEPLYLKARLVCDGATVMLVEVRWRLDTVPVDYQYVQDALPAEIAPRELKLDDMVGQAGQLALFLKRDRAAAMLPNLTRCLCPAQLASLLASTRLVGVECPGLHSVFAQIQLASNAENTDLKQLQYRVCAVNQRFSQLSMAIAAPLLSGEIKAFVRPSAIIQPNFAEFRAHVGATEFSEQRALIIGGSRGIGEVVAKLLCAGGAEVRLTYVKGQADATNVVDEICRGGGDATCWQYNVLEPAENVALLGGDWQPTHLYYFATPFIFSGVNGVFSPQRHQTFNEYYVVGFANILQRLVAGGLSAVFYPSTVAIDEQPLDMGEYCVAKIAGEALCDYFAKVYPNLSIYKPRLPRVATDQTVSLVSLENTDTLTEMKKQLQAFAAFC